MTAFIDWEETPVQIKKVPILMISEVMTKIRNTPVLEMVWWRGNIISPTLPSLNFF